MTWEQRLLADLAAIDFRPPPDARIHLALLVEPYLGRIERGEKTIESRWYRTRQAPYRAAEAGDIVLLKRSGGPIRGWAEVGRAVYEDCHGFGAPSASRLVETYRHGLGVGDDFAATVADKRYVSLLFLGRFHPLDAAGIVVGKTDQRGWVVLR